MKLDFSKIGNYRFNIWVVLAILALAVLLGVLNNFRVYEEQRVPWPWDDADYGESEEAEGTEAAGTEEA